MVTVLVDFWVGNFRYSSKIMRPYFASVTIEPISKRLRKEYAKRHKRKSKKVKERLQKQKKETARENRAKEFQKELIAKATPAEITLRSELVRLKVFHQFQYIVIGEFKTAIIDFCLPRKNRPKLFIEIDGGYHFTGLQKNLDQERTEWVREYTDCEFMRFTNEEVLNDTERVITEILCKDVWIKSAVGKCEAMQ